MIRATTNLYVSAGRIISVKACGARIGSSRFPAEPGYDVEVCDSEVKENTHAVLTCAEALALARALLALAERGE